MLRWLTAGESHGPALVATIDGLPAGVEVTTADVAAALARRRLGYGRGARMKFEQDEVEFLGGVRHGLHPGVAGRHPGRQLRVAEVADRDEPRPGRRRRAGRGRRRQRREGDRPQPAAHPAAPGARRPRRHAEVRVRRRPAGARAGLGPRDRGPGRARRGGRPVPPAGLRHPAGVAHRGDRRGRASPRTPRCRPPTTSRRSTPTRCARSTPAGVGRDGRRGRRRPQGRRHPRRGRRGGRHRPAAGPGLARALGPPARREARRPR